MLPLADKRASAAAKPTPTVSNSSRLCRSQLPQPAAKRLLAHGPTAAPLSVVTQQLVPPFWPGAETIRSDSWITIQVFEAEAEGLAISVVSEAISIHLLDRSPGLLSPNYGSESTSLDSIIRIDEAINAVYGSAARTGSGFVC
ncbi:hypothetical protein E4U43_004523, partial [Claviceps pusilla]